jgi:hypothetical protein
MKMQLDPRGGFGSLFRMLSNFFKSFDVVETGEASCAKKLGLSNET